MPPFHSERKFITILNQPLKKPLFRLDATQIIVLGFLGVVLVGTFLLMLPIATVSRETTPFIDALFTSTSAACVTGLTIAETGTYWSLFGKGVILLLIQIGGLGFMSIALLFSLVARRRITPRERMVFAQSQNLSDLSGIVKFAKFIFYGTFTVESVGALLLSVRFIPEYGISEGIAKSIFHAVSAFCNAGFDTIGHTNSLSDYAQDPYLSIIISLLVIVGGLGFFVWRDVLMYFRKKQRLSPYSKLVLFATVGLLVSGTLLLFAFENENPFFDTYSRPKLFLDSFFQSAVTRTAGFYSIPLSKMSSTSKAVSMVLMFIGGASGSTAGGIKVGTFAVIMIAMAATVRGKNNFVFAGRRISLNNVLRAMGILSVAIAVVSISTLAICLAEPRLLFADVLYEVISAFATVGQTLGITPLLSVFSKGIIILLMFFGRVGIITVTYAIMFNQAKSENLVTYPETNVPLG